MTRLRALLLAVAFLGCVPQRYYVADVHHEGGELVMTKCAIGYRGGATNNCHDEAVDGDGDNAYPDDDNAYGTPDPATIRHVEKQLAAMTPVSRPAPSDDTIAQAFRAKGVTKLVELCRTTYAADVTSVAVGVTVQPTGEIEVEPHGIDEQSNGRFAECTGRALRTANIEPYDGAPVHSELQLAL